MNKFQTFILIGGILCMWFAFAAADVYVQGLPKFSNNRLDEATRDRRNGNRLFDSQNNNRGGYNVGNQEYYGDEIVMIEYTNQHSCGKDNGKAHCELILQYACEEYIRDGAVTTTIPDDPVESQDLQYGMHESYEYYQECKQRPRNQGLFTASQNLQGDSARFTRQNPQGTRRGFECPEERDYYPYWHGSMWRDIAVFTDNEERCDFYRSQSQNVLAKGICVNSTLKSSDALAGRFTWADRIPQFNNEADCVSAGHQWGNDPAHDIDAPECLPTPWTRDNHLGNTLDGEMARYYWKVPDIRANRCALRLRYNISTGDYDGWNTDAQFNDREGLALGLSAKYGYTAPFQNNPQVDPFGQGYTLELAINTAQLGRTFQDRSHRFRIIGGPNDRKIHSLGVRGKRGNIVQVFPAVEYDFAPNVLTVDRNEYIHFQWTGSNTNPANNDGQGRQQSDRSNIVQCAGNDRSKVYPAQRESDDSVFFSTNFKDLESAVQLARLDADSSGQLRGDQEELDSSGTYFGRLVRAKEEGEYHYLCTRNNNFSNRQQKGTLIVDDGDDDDLHGGAIAGIVLGALAVLAGLAILAVVVRLYLYKRSKDADEDLEGYMAPADAEANVFSPLHEDD